LWTTPAALGSHSHACAALHPTSSSKALFAFCTLSVYGLSAVFVQRTNLGSEQKLKELAGQRFSARKKNAVFVAFFWRGKRKKDNREGEGFF